MWFNWFSSSGLFDCLVLFCEHLTYFGSSFNDKPLNDAVDGPLGNELFEKEQDDLLSDLKDIPKKACDRKVSFFYLLKLNFLLMLSCACL